MRVLIATFDLDFLPPTPLLLPRDRRPDLYGAPPSRPADAAADLAPWIVRKSRAVLHQAVGEWLGGARSREQALGDFDGMRAFWNVHGNGWLAAVRKDDCAVIGRVACRRLPAEWRHPMGRVVELGWALLPATWGRGYASEAAAAMLNWGFGALATPTIYAWTAAGNVRSQAVMRRIGMARAPGCDFDHPDLAADDPLRHHVDVAATRLQYQIVCAAAWSASSLPCGPRAVRAPPSAPRAPRPCRRGTRGSRARRPPAPHRCRAQPRRRSGSGRRRRCGFRRWSGRAS